METNCFVARAARSTTMTDDKDRQLPTIERGLLRCGHLGVYTGYGAIIHHPPLIVSRLDTRVLSADG